MNILFLSLSHIDITKKSIYADLLNVCLEKGHNVYSVCATQRRNKIATNVKTFKNFTVLEVLTGNITKTNIVEKGISTLLIETNFKAAIKKQLKNTQLCKK